MKKNWTTKKKKGVKKSHHVNPFEDKTNQIFYVEKDIFINNLRDNVSSMVLPLTTPSIEKVDGM